MWSPNPKANLLTQLSATLKRLHQLALAAKLLQVKKLIEFDNQVKKLQAGKSHVG